MSDGGSATSRIRLEQEREVRHHEAMVSTSGRSAQKSYVWHRLERAQVKESFLQEVFDNWPDRRRDHLFGVPDWLSSIEVGSLARGERTRHAFGSYRFTPDVEFVMPPVHYVLELKHGSKYEPLALAEVLHHAAWLRRYERKQASIVVPVIIASFNCWLRLAIDSLQRDTVRYYEADILVAPSSQGASSEPLVVLDAPLAPWEASSAPEWLENICENGELAWHEVRETGGWFGLRQPQRERPLVMIEPFVYAARGNNGLVVLWEGDPKTAGRYFLGEPRPGRPSAGEDQPTWLIGDA